MDGGEIAVVSMSGTGSLHGPAVSTPPGRSAPRSRRGTVNEARIATVTEYDPITGLEVFRSHWKMALNLMERGDFRRYTLDEAKTVVNHVRQMTHLLCEESMGAEKDLTRPLLDFFLKEEVLSRFVIWAGEVTEFWDDLKLEQLKIYEILLASESSSILSRPSKHLLSNEPILNPLLSLLGSCAECHSKQVENALIELLHLLCISISSNPSLLEVVFSVTNRKSINGVDKNTTDLESKSSSESSQLLPSLNSSIAISREFVNESFLIFSLLIPYTHKEGHLGQTARDALLLIMSLSSRHPHIGRFIASEEHSNFCIVLATGLSGLYSSLPRKLSPIIGASPDQWCHLTKEDAAQIPDLLQFLNSLEFCNAVTQAAHPAVKAKLLDFVYNGFLVPVIGPALHQDLEGIPSILQSNASLNSLEEVATATAYLDLFLRTITEPSLLSTFLRFILTEKHDEIVILDSLITRINSNSKLCAVSLSLFKTLVDLNREDVMLQLVLKYLLPLDHVMASQRSRAAASGKGALPEIETYLQAAPEKFLSMIPACCVVDEESHNLTMEFSRGDRGVSEQASLPGIANKSLLAKRLSFREHLKEYLDGDQEEENFISFKLNGKNSKSSSQQVDGLSSTKNTCGQIPHFQEFDVEEKGNEINDIKDSDAMTIPLQLLTSEVVELDVRQPSPLFQESINPSNSRDEDEFALELAQDAIANLSAAVKSSDVVLDRPLLAPVHSRRPLGFVYATHKPSPGIERRFFPRKTRLGSTSSLPAFPFLATPYSKPTAQTSFIEADEQISNDDMFFTDFSEFDNISSIQPYSGAYSGAGYRTSRRGSFSSLASTESFAGSTQPQKIPPELSYLQYLHDARKCVAECAAASNYWSSSYDESAILSRGPPASDDAKKIINIAPLPPRTDDFTIPEFSIQRLATTQDTNSDDENVGTPDKKRKKAPPSDSGFEGVTVETSGSTSAAISPCESSGSVEPVENERDETNLSRFSPIPSVLERAATPSNICDIAIEETIAELECLIAGIEEWRQQNEACIPTESCLKRVNPDKEESKTVIAEQEDPLSQFAGPASEGASEALEKITRNSSVNDPHSMEPNIVEVKSVVEPLKPSRTSSHLFHDSSVSSSASLHDMVTTEKERNAAFGNTIGPFLQGLLLKLEGMLHNSYSVNLLLTGLIIRLAAYPQPIIRSFLLHPNLVFQPNVKSLFQVLHTLKQRLDHFSYSVDNFEDLLVKSKRYLRIRELESGCDSSLNQYSIIPDSVSATPHSQKRPPEKESSRFRILADLFRSASSKKVDKEKKRSQIQLRIQQRRLQERAEVTQDGRGYRYFAKSIPVSATQSLDDDPIFNEMTRSEAIKLKNAVFSAVVLEEFLKELAATAQEQALFMMELKH